ncbi:MAG: Pyrimidine/purine nucleoside phosphorylase [Pseudomonadota bacterium]|nr:Pyrimidine/purine nucleoside phosphorylase [Pseudomonadota bacterium]
MSMINSGLLEILLLAQHKADIKLGLHSKRVACYAFELAKELNQSTEFKKRIFLAGLIHDFGFLKLDIDLSKTSLHLPLQKDAEFIQQHITEGENLLAKVIADKGIIEIIRHHHEKFNGKGYPEQLKGEEIPLAARILAIADLYDAMMVGDMYGDERSVPSDVVNYLKNTASGNDLDPELVEVFLGLLERTPVFYLPVEDNDLRLYKVVYLTPGTLELGDLCDQYGTILVGQGAELTEHRLEQIRSNYRGQKIIYVPTEKA